MKQFANLYSALNQAQGEAERKFLLLNFFQNSDSEESAWALYLLSGYRVAKGISLSKLRELASSTITLPEWLIEESESEVRDLGKMITLLLGQTSTKEELPLSVLVKEFILTPVRTSPSAQERAILSAWEFLEISECWCFNHILLGCFRPKVSRSLLVSVLSELSGVPPIHLELRLRDSWHPSARFFESLLQTIEEGISSPPPFRPLIVREQIDEEPSHSLAFPWYNGIRAQLLRRSEGETIIWSSTNEILTARFPEISTAASWLPEGVIIEGEIVAWRDNFPLPFGTLHKRLAARKLTKALREEAPVVFLANDLRAQNYEEILCPPTERWEKLQSIVASVQDPALRIAESFNIDTVKDQYPTLRERNISGILLRSESINDELWMAAPYYLKGVLTSVEPPSEEFDGQARYTLAVRDEGSLLTALRTTSGVTREIEERVDSFVRDNTLKKFGPVQTLVPRLIFEAAFTDIRLSPRHRSGFTIDGGRIIRMLAETSMNDVTTVSELRELVSI